MTNKKGAKPSSFCMMDFDPGVIQRTISRILSKCKLVPCRILDTPCIEWQGAVCNKNYPAFDIWDPIRKKRFWKRAHIVIWEVTNKRQVSPGHTLDHRCLNTRCVRAEHLEEVLRCVNTARGNRTRHGHAAEPARETEAA